MIRNNLIILVLIYNPNSIIYNIIFLRRYLHAFDLTLVFTSIAHQAELQYLRFYTTVLGDISRSVLKR